LLKALSDQPWMVAGIRGLKPKVTVRVAQMLALKPGWPAKLLITYQISM
jgi:hypothetical protein